MTGIEHSQHLLCLKPFVVILFDGGANRAPSFDTLISINDFDVLLFFTLHIETLNVSTAFSSYKQTFAYIRETSFFFFLFFSCLFDVRVREYTYLFQYYGTLWKYNLHTCMYINSILIHYVSLIFMHTVSLFLHIFFFFCYLICTYSLVCRSL